MDTNKGILMKQFNHLRKALKIRNNKHCSTVELDNVNVKMPRKKLLNPGMDSSTNDNTVKVKFKLPNINK